MIFVVFEKLGVVYNLVACYQDFNKLMEDWDEKFGEGYHWEPWPTDMRFDEKDEDE